MVNNKKFDYRHSGFQVRIRDSFVPEVVRLEEQLGKALQASEVSTEESLEAALGLIRRIGDEFRSRAISIEDLLCVKRSILECEYSAVLKSKHPNPRFLISIIRQLELVGFEYPTRYADMWLEVAHQLKRVGDSDKAKAHCKKVLADLVALRTQLEALIKYAEDSLERMRS